MFFSASTVNEFFIRDSAGFAVEKNANYGKKVSNLGTLEVFSKYAVIRAVDKDHLQLMPFRLAGRAEKFRLL